MLDCLVALAKVVQGESQEGDYVEDAGTGVASSTAFGSYRSASCTSWRTPLDRPGEGPPQARVLIQVLESCAALQLSCLLA